MTERVSDERLERIIANQRTEINSLIERERAAEQGQKNQEVITRETMDALAASRARIAELEGHETVEATAERCENSIARHMWKRMQRERFYVVPLGKEGWRLRVSNGDGPEAEFILNPEHRGTFTDPLVAVLAYTGYLESRQKLTKDAKP